MPAFDRCPMCKKPFLDCNHSVVQVQAWQSKQEVRKVVLDILKEYDLIPKVSK